MELTKEEIELIEKKRIKEAKKKKEQESSVISKEEKDYLFNLYNSEEKPLDYEGFCKYLDNKDYTRRNWIKLFIEYKKGVSIEELANRRGIKVSSLKTQFSKIELYTFGKHNIQTFVLCEDLPITIIKYKSFPINVAKHIKDAGINNLSELKNFTLNELHKKFNSEDMDYILSAVKEYNIHLIDYKEPYFMPIEDADFSVRTYNGLRRVGIDTLGEISNMTFTELKEINGLGSFSQKEIIGKLAYYGLKIRGYY